MIRKPYHQKVLKKFVSNIDIQLKKFNATHPLSPSQQAEVTKYLRISELRDDPNLQRRASKTDLWDFKT